MKNDPGFFAKNESTISVLYVESTHPSIPNATVQRPTWEQIEDAVLQMDGRRRCEVTLVVDDERTLQIGGGDEHHYVCHVELPQGSFVLCDTSQPEGELIRINNGQPSLYDAQHVVDREKVFQATRHFVSNIALDPSLNWYKY